MKRISARVLALFVTIAFGACTEVPVRQVEKCATVIDVIMSQYYLFGVLSEEEQPRIYKILDNGKYVRIYRENYYMLGVKNWLENAKKMEIGRNYCWTEYERIK